MEVLSLSFTKRNGIRLSDLPTYLLQLEASEHVVNHLGSVHGSALFALAEITSGYYLYTNFTDIADQTIPILRSSSVKYRKMGDGTIHSTAVFEGTNVDEISSTLLYKHKVLLTIAVKLYNAQHEVVMTGDFEWFVTSPKRPESNS